MSGVDITENKEGVVLAVKVIPGGSRTAIAGVLDGMLKVKISAPAERGKANQSLIEFLAKRLSVKKKAVSIVSGHTSPLKKVQICGLTAENISGELIQAGKRSNP
ncbi:MAG: DUF167 domain-containing protein [Planctomycetota bacterium]|jgi:uncharacterized protein (TIGR00251 family)